MINSKNVATILFLIKWPIAILCLFFLPASVMMMWHQLIIFNQKSSQFINLILGFGIYMLIWYYYIRKTNVSILSTFEHEITHCIFAWLTLNRVVSLTATLKKGGHMKYVDICNIADFWSIRVFRKSLEFYPHRCLFRVPYHFYFSRNSSRANWFARSWIYFLNYFFANSKFNLLFNCFSCVNWRLEGVNELFYIFK